MQPSGNSIALYIPESMILSHYIDRIVLFGPSQWEVKTTLDTVPSMYIYHNNTTQIQGPASWAMLTKAEVYHSQDSLLSSVQNGGLHLPTSRASLSLTSSGEPETSIPFTCGMSHSLGKTIGPIPYHQPPRNQFSKHLSFLECLPLLMKHLSTLTINQRPLPTKNSYSFP